MRLMIIVKKCILVLCYIVLTFSCNRETQKAFFSCSTCADLQGLTLEVKEDNIYNFRLSYPVGYFDINKNTVPYLKFDLLLKDMTDRLMVYDSIRNMFTIFLDFDHQSRETEIRVEDRKVKVSVDTSFNISGRHVYEVRMENLYQFDIEHSELGRYFVFFLSSKGIEGMYISDTEVFRDHIKE